MHPTQLNAVTGQNKHMACELLSRRFDSAALLYGRSNASKV